MRQLLLLAVTVALMAVEDQIWIGLDIDQGDVSEPAYSMGATEPEALRALLAGVGPPFLRLERVRYRRNDADGEPEVARWGDGIETGTMHLRVETVLRVWLLAGDPLALDDAAQPVPVRPPAL